MLEARNNTTKTQQIARPTYYVQAINSEFSQFAYDEERAMRLKGQWRRNGFFCSEEVPLDLEIGTGNGFFFAHRSTIAPQRMILGVELKFKPVIQTIRRALNNGAKNARVVRYNAKFISEIIDTAEVDNIYIHHPDPWNKRSENHRRLVNTDYLNQLFLLQKPGSFLDFKTDSRDYYLWSMEALKNSYYRLERSTENLHQSVWSGENFQTHFERLFASQGQTIHYWRAIRE